MPRRRLARWTLALERPDRPRLRREFVFAGALASASCSPTATPSGRKGWLCAPSDCHGCRALDLQSQSRDPRGLHLSAGPRAPGGSSLRTDKIIGERISSIGVATLGSKECVVRHLPSPHRCGSTTGLASHRFFGRIVARQGVKGERNQAIGRSRAGRTTKIHALTDGL